MINKTIFTKNGKIGIFDSGLGGLVIAGAVFKELPDYEYIYLGDAKRLPYGNKTSIQVYKYTSGAVKYLFDEGCDLVILACNTASALALRKIQREFLPKYYPDRRVLGVVIPTLESIFPPLPKGEGRLALRRSQTIGAGGEGNRNLIKIGVIGTTATIRSHIYKKELMKINPKAKIFEMAAPKLVPLIEQNSLQKAQKTLKLYLNPLLKHNIEALVLGCTHYPILKKEAENIVGKKVKVISQTDFLPGKLKDYLKRHPEIKNKLLRTGKKEFLVTSFNTNFDDVARRLFGNRLKFKVVKL